LQLLNHAKSLNLYKFNIMTTQLSRRDFLRTGAVGLVGLTIVPNTILGKKAGYTAPSDKLNIAGVGVGKGGKGIVNLRNMKSENIVAMCDVDWDYSKEPFAEFPDAKKFWDYREMFDKMGKGIDAVVIATPDHTHAMIAADAMTLGKHVYLQKPLTHTVYESRLMTKLAEKYKICSQMGDEGASNAAFRVVSDLVLAGELGEVTKVEAYTNRPIWPQGLPRPTEVHQVPDTLKWELFIGPAEMRPFNKAYHPWNWRGWWDFGTGALGDMACHILHPVYHALNLGNSFTIQSSSTALLSDSAPHAQWVRYSFPSRGMAGKTNLSEMTLDWIDGGLKPPRPKGMPEEKKLGEGGVIYHGTKDTLITAAGAPFLLSGRKIDVPSQNREITISHELDWVRACKENASSRVKPVSDFGEAGPLNEMIVAGVAAIRLQGLGKELIWDGTNMKFTNISSGDTLSPANRGEQPINAQEFAQNMLKHNYKNGFKLVDMP